MSMLSAQIDKLRKAAQTYRTLGGHEMEHTLLDAADTIDGLRCRCQDAQADNIKLRHENDALRAEAIHWELGNCPSCPNVADLQEAISEREKLRELVRDLESARSALCDEYPSRIDVACDECPAHNVCDANPIGRMRELGIEVDG